MNKIILKRKLFVSDSWMKLIENEFQNICSRGDLYQSFSFPFRECISLVREATYLINW